MIKETKKQTRERKLKSLPSYKHWDVKIFCNKKCARFIDGIIKDFEERIKRDLEKDIYGTK